jgi:hypothetical protein
MDERVRFIARLLEGETMSVPTGFRETAPRERSQAT